MGIGITALRWWLAGKGDDQGFLFGRDGWFFSSSGFVGEPGADQFFVHFWPEVGIEEFPEFVMFVKSVALSGNAMLFDSVLILNLTVGEIFCGGECDLCSYFQIVSSGISCVEDFAQDIFFRAAPV